MVSTLLLAVQITAMGQSPRHYTREQLEALANPSLAEGADNLHFDKREYSLGEVSEDAGMVKGSYSMQNSTPSPIVILKATTDCGCLKVSFPTRPIAAGESASIDFEYNPKGYPGGVARSILLYTNLSATAPSAKLTLSGRVKPSSDMSERFPYAKGEALLKGESVSFTANSSKQVERILAYNSSNHQLHITSLMKPLPQGLELRTEPAIVAAKSEFDIVISFDPAKWEGGTEPYRLMLDGVESAPKNSVIKINFR